MTIDSLFDVSGMHCGSCVRRITRALDALDGVAELRASVADRTVRVRHDPARVGADEIARALGDAGYPSTVRAP